MLEAQVQIISQGCLFWGPDKSRKMSFKQKNIWGQLATQTLMTPPPQTKRPIHGPENEGGRGGGSFCEFRSAQNENCSRSTPPPHFALLRNKHMSLGQMRDSPSANSWSYKPRTVEPEPADNGRRVGHKKRSLLLYLLPLSPVAFSFSLIKSFYMQGLRHAVA